MRRVRLSTTALALVLLLGCGGAERREHLDLATTTSVQQTGLLDHLLAVFEPQSVIDIRVHAVGSGLALRMLADRTVQVVISHAPEAEARVLADHGDWSYRKIAHNTFVVVGPASDPAGVRQSPDVVDAFRRIADRHVNFVTRGDHSGTHERENMLWALAGRQPSPGNLIVSGRGMTLALRHADEVQGYTLTDEPTFRQVRPGLDLAVLFDGDARLLNTYAVIYRTNDDPARRFAEWLGGKEGRSLIAGYELQGLPAFSVWPESCPHERPDATPCAR